VVGGLKWKTQLSEYIIGVGDAVFVKRGAHTAYKINDGDLCGLLVFIPDEFIKKILQNHRPSLSQKREPGNSDSIIPIEVDENLSNYFNSILTYFSQSSPPSKNLLQVRFEEFILNIMGGGKNELLARYFQDICCDNKRSIKAIMEENFTYNLKLEEYARLCNRSLATFKREFEKIYHTTPGRWLKAKRLEYSRFLLETTDMNISEITLGCGFENNSHFIKCFRERYGQPPLHFRKLMVEGG